MTGKRKILLILWISACLGFFSYSFKKYIHSIKKIKQDKIIIIGIDGFTWKVINPLLKEGKLPNIKALIDKGSYGVLNSIEPMKSPMLWTTIATGKKGEKHGILDFEIKISEKSYKSILVPSTARKTKALWNILTDYHRMSGVINWWASWPAEKIKGFIVSDRYFLSLIKEEKKECSLLTYPENLFTDKEKNRIKRESRKKAVKALFDILGYRAEDIIKFGSYADFTLSMEFSPHFWEKFLTSYLYFMVLWDLTVKETAAYLLKKSAPDLLAVYFKGADSIQHYFWQFMDKENFDISAEERAKFGSVIQKYYQFMDTLIGELLVKIKNRNYTIIIISDHGFKAVPGGYQVKLYNFNLLFEAMGWLKRVSDDTQQIDWSNTIIYDCTQYRLFDSYREFYINLKGREKTGIVPVEKFADLQKKIQETLLNMRTSDGKSVFLNVEIIPLSERGVKKISPDLKVKVNPGISLRDNVYARDNVYGKDIVIPVSKFIFPLTLTGDHAIDDGVIIASGSLIKKGAYIEHADVRDITPTVLALMGIPIGEDMDGKVLTGIISEGFLKKHPVTFISTHDSEMPKEDDIAGGSPFDDVEKNRLKSLGYIQ